MTRSVSILLTAAVLCLAGNAWAEDPAAKPGNVSKPNILFLALDDPRPLIGAYGGLEPITPCLDALASEGGAV